MSDEYVILVGTAYDSSTGKLFYLPSNKDGTLGSVSYVGDLGDRSGAGIAAFNNDGYLDFVAGAGVTSSVANFYLFNYTGSGNFTQSLIAPNLNAGGLSNSIVKERKTQSKSEGHFLQHRPHEAVRIDK